MPTETINLAPALTRLCRTIGSAPIRWGLGLSALYILFAFMAPPTSQPDQTLMVRVTAYWAEGEGTDSWSAKNISSSGERLTENFSVAVDPNIIPYGSRIHWPDGDMKWKAVDTGRAVKNRTAAKAWGKDVPVVDVFFQKKEDALAFTYQIPKFIEIEVFHPESS